MANPPMVHLNGTGKQQLIDVREKAWYALSDAYAAMRNIAPNGRDYYPYGLGAYEAATDEHESRLSRIQSVIDELAVEMVKIQDQ